MTYSWHLEFSDASWQDVQERASRRFPRTASKSELDDEKRKAILRGAVRDGVILPKPEFQFPLIAGILRHAVQNQNQINVLDFGGSLGNVYFQFKQFVSLGIRIRWNVVELREVVDCGRKYFQDDEVHFYYSVDECIASTSPTIILLSGVLQNLESPAAVLHRCREIDAGTLIIDRTLCSDLTEDKVAVQKIVIDGDLRAENPRWVFSAPQLMQKLSEHWQLVSRFESVVDLMTVVDGIPVHHCGFLFERMKA
jgi:putative methyltransferase (TIGR04325 family)